MLKKLGLTAFIAGALTLFSPAAALAQGHHGGGGRGSAGHSFSGGRGFSGGGSYGHGSSGRNFGGGGGRYFPSIVVVALGEPGVPVICCEAAGRPEIVATATDANNPSRMLLVALMVRSSQMLLPSRAQ